MQENATADKPHASLDAGRTASVVLGSGGAKGMAHIGQLAMNVLKRILAMGRHMLSFERPQAITLISKNI